MLAARQALSTLPDIYDAAIDPSIWSRTLDKGAQVLGAKGAILLIIDQHSEGGFAVNHYSQIWSRAPERTAMYNEKFAHYEKPVWNKLFGMPKQTPVLDTEFWADVPDLRNRPDYQYLRENVGIVHKCAARLNDNLSWWDTLVLHFDEKIKKIPPDSITSLVQILPHVAKSVELARSFDNLKKQYDAVLTVLDHVQVGLCIALENGDIVIKNREACRILDEKDGIRLSNNGKIFCFDSTQNAQLQSAIEKVSKTACGENNTHELLLVSDRCSGREALLVEVAPLRDYSSELDRNLTGALITLVDQSNTQPFSVNRTVAAYKLTKAESAVCQLLVDGSTTTEIAEKRNVSPETVKTQVKSVLQKTHCSRRSDLIRLVLKATPPIADL